MKSKEEIKEEHDRIVKQLQDEDLYDTVNKNYDTKFKEGDIEEFEDDDMRTQLSQSDIEAIIDAEKGGEVKYSYVNYSDDSRGKERIFSASWDKRNYSDPKKELSNWLKKYENQKGLEIIEKGVVLKDGSLVDAYAGGGVKKLQSMNKDKTIELITNKAIENKKVKTKEIERKSFKDMKNSVLKSEKEADPDAPYIEDIEDAKDSEDLFDLYKEIYAATNGETMSMILKDSGIKVTDIKSKLIAEEQSIDVDSRDDGYIKDIKDSKNVEDIFQRVAEQFGNSESDAVGHMLDSFFKSESRP